MTKNWGEEFIRQGKVDITEYLPEFLRKDVELKAVCDAESLEHERVRDEIKDVFAQLYVPTATWGLSLWEQVLELYPDKDATDEYRRANILYRLRGLKTSTIDAMNEIINTYGSGYVEEHNDRYYFNVYAAVNDESARKLMKSAIVTYKPAHLGLNAYLGYSWNGDIKFDGSYTFSTHQEDWSDVKL